jgi:hypothetical protein
MVSLLFERRQLTFLLAQKYVGIFSVRIYFKEFIFLHLIGLGADFKVNPVIGFNQKNVF